MSFVFIGLWIFGILMALHASETVSTVTRYLRKPSYRRAQAGKR